MLKPQSREELERTYREAAQDYERRQTQGASPETCSQTQQRIITLASLAILRAQRPEVHVFNELQVEYSWAKHRGVRRVVPDNLVVVHFGVLMVTEAYQVEMQPSSPFWVLDYLTKHHQRKDYDENRTKYEREMKVPYYLRFLVDGPKLTLYHHNGEKYVSVKPNEHDRLAIPELELEVALLDNWVRFWYRGELLPLPADLLQELKAAQRQLQQAQQQVEQERHGRLAAEQEVAQLRAELEQLRGGPA